MLIFSIMRLAVWLSFQTRQNSVLPFASCLLFFFFFYICLSFEPHIFMCPRQFIHLQGQVRVRGNSSQCKVSTWGKGTWTLTTAGPHIPNFTFSFFPSCVLAKPVPSLTFYFDLFSFADAPCSTFNHKSVVICHVHSQRAVVLML